jgi:hypothetical protein
VDDKTLRRRLIRLAYERPDLRDDLLPLVKKGTRAKSKYGITSAKWGGKFVAEVLDENDKVVVRVDGTTRAEALKKARKERKKLDEKDRS